MPQIGPLWGEGGTSLQMDSANTFLKPSLSEMVPIILIYLPRHLEMVTCQENIIHNISNKQSIIYSKD